MNKNSTPWKMVMLLCATATASYICRVNVSTAGPLLMEEFGLSQIEMGRVFSAFLLGYALFQVPAGALADKWGAAKILGWAAWLWVALTVIQSLTGWGPLQVTGSLALAVFLISRFLLGVSESPTFPGAAKGVAMWVQPGFTRSGEWYCDRCSWIGFGNNSAACFQYHGAFRMAYCFSCFGNSCINYCYPLDKNKGTWD